VTADHRIVHNPQMQAVSLEAGLLTGHRSTMSTLSPVILEGATGGLMCAHFEQRYGFRVVVQLAGEAWDRVLIDPNLSGETVEVQEGRRSVQLARYGFVSEQLALRAMKHYAATGDRCPSCHWRDV
jgi:hypothetical protein